MERADWLEAGYDAAQARFLMLTAITQHRFSSPRWGDDAIRGLHADLADIDHSAARVLAARRGFAPEHGGTPSGMYGLHRHPAGRPEQEEQEAC